MVQTWVTLCGAKLQPVGTECSDAKWVTATIGAGVHWWERRPTSESLEPCASSASFRIVSPRPAGTSVGSSAKMPTAVGPIMYTEIESEGPSGNRPAAHRRDKGWYDGESQSTNNGGRASSHRPCTQVYRRSKNAPETATSCHFSAPPARPTGGGARSASRCNIMRSDLTCGVPGRSRYLVA